MARHQTDSTEPETTENEDLRQEADIAAIPAGPSVSGELSRWADLVAGGSIAFPKQWSSDQQQALAKEVRRRRRDRLISFIAHMIALDIVRNRDI